MKRSSIAKLCTAVTMLSVILSAVLVAADAPWWAPAVAVLVGMCAFLLGALLRRNFQTVTRPLGIQRDYRAGWLLVAAFAAVRTAPDLIMLGAIVLVLGLALVFSETSLGPRWSRLYPPVRNLPDMRSYPAVRSAITGILCLEFAAVFALFLTPAAGVAAAWVALGLILAAGAVAALLTVAAMALDDGISERRWEALRSYEPRFAVYFSAPGGSEYQVRMWLPYLERIGEPWVIILRERRYLTQFASQTSVPVVVAASLAELDAAMAPSLTTVFYVNNSYKNSHCVRYADRTHIQLLHGDSDKVASFNPVTAMFDRIFVAGQAGLDRYANHGVEIPREKFEIVGRPQVEEIEPLISPDLPVREMCPVVLYAPTWRGYHGDANFSSLPVAERIIHALVDAEVDVIFRPHPFSVRHRDSATLIEQVEAMLASDPRVDANHRFGKAAQEEISLVECMNLSHALVTDISSVPGDYLFSGKPFITVKLMDDLTTDEFVVLFPLAQASYVWDADSGQELGPIIEKMLGPDPSASARARMRDYYLGDFDSDGYAEHFVQAARRHVLPRRETHGS